MAPTVHALLDKITGFLGRPVIMGFPPLVSLIPHDNKSGLLIQIFTGHNTKHAFQSAIVSTNSVSLQLIL